jgi:hypothetical protein
MTRVLVYFTSHKQQDEEIEIDVPAEELDYPTVTDALRAAYPFDEVELDDFEVLKGSDES